MNILVKNQPQLTSVGNRHYRLENNVTFKIRLDFDDLMVAPLIDRPVWLEFSVLPGAIIDFRSGGPLVDFFTEQIPADPIRCAAYIAHDMLYTKCYHGSHFCSRLASDQILRKLLRLGGMSKFKSTIIYKAVRFGGTRAYEDEDKYSEQNKYKFYIGWCKGDEQ